MNNAKAKNAKRGGEKLRIQKLQVCENVHEIGLDE